MKGLESMNALIMGSFFVVALLAFLAALWLAYIENQEMMAKAKTSMSDSSAVPTTPALTVPVSITTEKNSQKQSAVASTAQLAVTTEPFQSVVSSGQLYEMTLELRSLRIQANEINERLLALVSLVENFQEISSSSTAREKLAV
jgi:uncharacterized membrane protein